MIYVLGYPEFEPSHAERIDAFRLKHEPERAAFVPPHVTLVFAVKDVHLASVTERVQDISSQSQDVSIEFRNTEIDFDPFEEKYKIFLQCGEGGEKITALHKRLYQGEDLPELASGHPFRPHMTIATYDTRAEIEQVDVSELGTLPIFGKLRALEIVRFAHGNLSLIKTAPFLR